MTNDFKYQFNNRILNLNENLGNSCCGHNSGTIYLKGSAGNYFGYENTGCIIVEGNCGIGAARDNGKRFLEILVKNGKEKICEEKEALFYVKGSVGYGFGNNNGKKGICYADDIVGLCGIDNEGIIIGKRFGHDIGFSNKGVIVILESVKSLYKGVNPKNIILPNDNRINIYIDKLNNLLEKYGFSQHKIKI
ncbi:MAG: hypothetical protein QXQ79_00710 [Candidatus Nanoarchaeia archaeon]